MTSDMSENIAQRVAFLIPFENVLVEKLANKLAVDAGWARVESGDFRLRDLPQEAAFAFRAIAAEYAQALGINPWEADNVESEGSDQG